MILVGRDFMKKQKSIVEGMSSKIYLEADDKEYYNVFMDIDFISDSVLSDILEFLNDIDFPLFLISTKKGYHIISYVAYPPKKEKEIYDKIFNFITVDLKQELDYVHYMDYTKLKEDFNVLRVSIKYNEYDLKPVLIKLPTNYIRMLIQSEKVIFTPDIFYIYKVKDSLKTEFDNLKSDFKDRIYNYKRELILYETPKPLK